MCKSEITVPIATARNLAFSCCKLFGFLSVLNGLFWFLSDFGKFTPPSEGIFLERLIYFIVAEAGPLAVFLYSGTMIFSWHLLWWFVPAVLIAFGLLFPNKKFARFSAFSGVFLWLFFGFATAAMRNT